MVKAYYNTNVQFIELFWQRPYSEDAVTELLSHLATTTPRGVMFFEARCEKRQMHYLLGVEAKFLPRLKRVIESHGDVRFRDVAPRQRREVTKAAQLNISKPQLSLNTDVSAACIRAALAAMVNQKKDELSVVQVVLGGAYKPRPTPRPTYQRNASWLDQALFGIENMTPDSTRNMRAKNELFAFDCTIRIGADSRTPREKIGAIYNAFRTMESAGVRLSFKPDNPDKLNLTRSPWRHGGRLSVKELTGFMLLPFGEEELPGTAKLHPKLTRPPAWYKAPGKEYEHRTFARTHELFGEEELAISPRSSLEHTLLMGPTGSGKSTAMLNLILADARAGRSILVIDPKADLITDIIERLPKNRLDDVVIIDPTEACPTGFNPLSLPGDPNLIADAILAVFQEIFKENWGIRSQDVMSAALLTLKQIPGATLMWLPALLTDEAFREWVTNQLGDDIVLRPYWESFNAMKDSEKKQEIAPVMNKIRQFLFRPSIRAVIGQSEPKFQLTDLFYKRKIVLVPLNKGTIGPEAARLLGSLIIGLTWTLVLSRASIPPEKRHIVSVYIDELQDYLALPTNLSDALAQARGLGVGMTLAHQYRSQLPAEIRAGVDTNTRNKIIFGLNVSDAKDMAAMAPELTEQDFMQLERYDIYANFMQAGRATGWVWGHTLAPPDPLRSAYTVRARCQARYGVSHETVDLEYRKLPTKNDANKLENIPETSFGRRKL